MSVSMIKTTAVASREVTVGDTIFLPSQFGPVRHQGRIGRFGKVVAIKGQRGRVGMYLVALGAKRPAFVTLPGTATIARRPTFVTG